MPASAHDEGLTGVTVTGGCLSPKAAQPEG